MTDEKEELIEEEIDFSEELTEEEEEAEEQVEEEKQPDNNIGTVDLAALLSKPLDQNLAGGYVIGGDDPIGEEEEDPLAKFTETEEIEPEEQEEVVPIQFDAPKEAPPAKKTSEKPIEENGQKAKPTKKSSGLRFSGRAGDNVFTVA